MVCTVCDQVLTISLVPKGQRKVLWPFLSSQYALVDVALALQGLSSTIVLNKELGN